jgi:2-C-methyl-D-erythritol 4-phosphate cytidylyltransferase
MIHDAARANLHLSDIQKLKQTISSEIDGGILAKPAQDTLKHIASTHNLTTLDRSRIWHAMTPQMFRLGPLINALRGANQAKIEITDESSAMEIAGASVILVHGRTDNIKLTYPEDLPILEKLIEERNAQK